MSKLLKGCCIGSILGVTDGDSFDHISHASVHCQIPDGLHEINQAVVAAFCATSYSLANQSHMHMAHYHMLSNYHLIPIPVKSVAVINVDKRS